MQWDFGLNKVEQLFEMHLPMLSKEQSDSRIRIAHSFGKQSPELVTKGQFKLVMTDVFKVRDSRLLDNVFLIADIDGAGALDIREICASMIMHMRGAIEHKLALLFEVMKNRSVPELSEGGFILKQNLIKIIADANKFFKQAFFAAKQAADLMNTNLDGKISFEEFLQYCRKHPSAMDFICRLTVNPGGKYPPGEDDGPQIEEP